MDFDIQHQLDEIDWQILVILQENGRISYSELGRRVGLSAPATTDRMRRMEEAGVIRGYHADVSLPALGRPVLAFVRVRMMSNTRDQLMEHLQNTPAVLESYRITGEDSFIAKVAAPSIQALEQIVSALLQYGSVSTSVVLSTTVQGRTIHPPE